jgi:hypothetical protein
MQPEIRDKLRLKGGLLLGRFRHSNSFGNIFRML